MLPFSELRFPEDIAYGALGGPEFYTDVTSSKSGYEYRNVAWNSARTKYNISYGVQNKYQLEILLAFFRIHKGRAVGFRFKDWIDYQITHQELDSQSIVNGSFPLFKIYKVGDHSYKRRIHKPVKGSFELKIEDRRLTNQDFSVDYTSGIVTLTNQVIKAAESERLILSCEFDLPMRFDTDFLPCSLENYGAYSIKNVNLLEIKY